MPDPFDDIYIAKEPAQRRALTSPIRLEIIEHFLQGPLAVADLAARMGRRPDSLYYHVRTLAEVGLLLPAGTRKRGKRHEAIYKLPAAGIGIGGEEGDPTLFDDAMKTFSAGVRMTERELRDAMESGRMRQEGDGRNNLCFRLKCRLRPAALKKINKHLNDMLMLFDREFKQTAYDDETAQLCSFLFAMIPLASRNVEG